MEKQQVIDLMKSSKNESEWNRNCDKVKEAHDGKYPDYWYKEISLSWLFSKISIDWID